MAFEDILTEMANRPLPTKKVQVLDQPKIEQIKQEFKLTPQQDVVVAVGNAAEETQPQSQAPVAQKQMMPKYSSAQSYMEQLSTPSVPLYDSIDAQKIKNKATEFLPERTTGDYLSYLAPLAVEALLGGGESGAVGAGIAGTEILKDQTIREQRQRQLEDKLLEMEKLRAKTSSTKNGRRYQLKNVEDLETGDRFLANFDSATGDIIDASGAALNKNRFKVATGQSFEEFAQRQDLTTKKKIELGEEFGQGIVKDPETGLLVRKKGNKLIPVQEPTSAMNPEQKKYLEKTVKEFKNSPAFKEPSAVIRAAAGIDDLLNTANSGNPVAANLAIKEIAKIAEGASRLTDKDVEIVQGGQSSRSKAARFLNLQDTDLPLMPKDIEALREVARLLEATSRKKVMDSVGNLEKSFIQKGGIPGAVQTEMMPFITAPTNIQPKSPTESKTYFHRNVPGGTFSPLPKKPTFEEWKKSKGL
jgi:hypothetical protein